MDSRRRFARPLGLLGMLAVVAVVEPFVAWATPRWSHTVVLDWRETGRSVVRETPGCDVLCFGSSMSKFGVLPKVIEAHSGRRAYNFALLNGPPPASYFLLKRAFDRGARPSVVVVDFDQFRLGADPRSAEFNYPWAELLQPAEVIDLARQTGDVSVYGRLTVQDALPSVRRRHDIRMAALARANGYAGPLDVVGGAFGSTKLAFDRNRRVNRGAVANPKAVPGQNPQVRPLKKGPEGWSCDPVNAHYVRRFFQLCGERRTAVLWLIPPVAPEEQTMRNRLRIEDRYLQFVRELAAEFPNVTVVDGRSAAYPGSVFVDHVHLDRDGATALSVALTSIMNDRTAETAPRWLDLPRFTMPAREEGVEDLVQSKMALEAAGVDARQGSR